MELLCNKLIGLKLGSAFVCEASLLCLCQAQQIWPLSALSCKLYLLQCQGSDVSCSNGLVLSSAASVQGGAGVCQGAVCETVSVKQQGML